jgi:hypothetical protein
MGGMTADELAQVKESAQLPGLDADGNAEGILDGLVGA